jgi:Aldehyde dehydrogenase family
LFDLIDVRVPVDAAVEAVEHLGWDSDVDIDAVPSLLSDRMGEFGGCGCETQRAWCIDGEFVVAATRVLHERQPSDDHLSRPVGAQPPRIGRRWCLKRLWSASIRWPVGRSVPRPTVLADVDPAVPRLQRGSVRSRRAVVSFDTVEEAIELASGIKYGLSLAVFGDVGLALTVADAVPSGIIHINEQTVADKANIPFGGVANSGTGSRFGGLEANLEAFTETQWPTVRSTIAPYPL